MARLNDILEKLDQRLDMLEEKEYTKKKKKDKKMSLKIPSALIRQVNKDPNASLALILGHNRRAQFHKGTYEDGVLYVQGRPYSYEENAVYHLPYKKKMIPFVVLHEWRITPVGGDTEKYKVYLLNSKEDHDAEERIASALKNHGQMTIIRGIEQAEVNKDGKKKSPGIGIGFWIVGIGILVYLITQFFKGG